MESTPTADAMQIQELYVILGKLTLHYSKVELVAASIAKEMGIVDNPYLFFAKKDSREKIRLMRKHAQNLTDPDMRKGLLKWLGKFDSLRKDRNSVTHSVILVNGQNDDDYVLFSYSLSLDKDKVESLVTSYDSEMFRRLEERLREVNNRGYEIFLTMSKAGHLFKPPQL